MKWEYGMVLLMNVCVSLLGSSCTKEAVVPAFAREQPHAPVLLDPISRPPVFPDSLIRPVFLKPVLPRVPLVLTRCIGSYAELLAVLGSPSVPATAVVLENGSSEEVVVPLGPDLAAIIYTAVDNPTGSSLFTSQLRVNWRRPGDYWQTHFSEVWSLGCVYNNAAYPPFTNLKKGNVIIDINTSIYWGAMPYQGWHIKYIVLE